MSPHRASGTQPPSADDLPCPPTCCNHWPLLLDSRATTQCGLGSLLRRSEACPARSSLCGSFSEWLLRDRHPSRECRRVQADDDRTDRGKGQRDRRGPRVAAYLLTMEQIVRVLHRRGGKTGAEAPFLGSRQSTIPGTGGSAQRPQTVDSG